MLSALSLSLTSHDRGTAQFAVCNDGECAPLISQTQFGGPAAIAMSDGKSEAIIVPSIGRVMSYRPVDRRPNLTLVAPPKNICRQRMEKSGR
jgi:hypothetical protein